MNTEYVCIDGIKTQDGANAVVCSPVVANEVVLSKQHINDIGGVLVMFFAALVAYFMIVKAIKEA